MDKIVYEDHRSKKIVALSHCILNINSKFLGVADVAGSYTDLLFPIMEEGIGIFQMPCCEVMGWGGVHRTRLLEYEQLDRDNLQEVDWISEYPKLATKWALWTADRLEDFTSVGYDLMGIIYVSDSPTCGLEGVSPFPQCHIEGLEEGLSYDHLIFDELFHTLESPESMAKRVPDGKGVFMVPLRDELSKRGINTKWLSFWPNPDMERMKRQNETILDALGISPNS